jgi:hypothetical protein
MNMVTYAKEAALNRQAYDNLRVHIQTNFAGKHVALAHGKIIGVASSFDDARALVLQLKPVPEYYLVFPAGSEPSFDLVYDLVGSV